MRVIEVESGKLVDGPIDRGRYSPVAWLPDAEAFYYVRRLAPDLVPEGETQFHRRVYLHRLGADPAEDVLVFGEGLEKTNYYGVSVSRDGRWIAVESSRGTSPSNDLHIADLEASGLETPRWTAVQEGVDARVSLHFGLDGKFYLLTDREASNVRLCVAEPDAVGYEQWREVLPEDPKAVLEDYALLDGEDSPRVLALYAWDGVSELRLFDPATDEPPQSVATPGAGTVTGLHEHPDGGPRAWFGYTDYLTPPKVLVYDAQERKVDTWAESPGAVELGEVHVTRAFYPSKDGTSVPMSIIAPAAQPDRPRPTILYGYGGFNVNLSPAFSALQLAWVEAGGVFAIANLRGGSEEGESWHRAGMLGDKQNVFDDFHAAGDWLVRERPWTTREQLGISGGSNGGLLVGAALTQRPGRLCRSGLLGAAAGHAALRAVRPGRVLERRVRLGAGARGIRLVAGLFAVPQRARGHRVSGDPVRDLRGRHPRRHAARPQAHRRAPARDVRRDRAAAGLGAAGAQRRPQRPRGLAFGDAVGGSARVLLPTVGARGQAGSRIRLRPESEPDSEARRGCQGSLTNAPRQGILTVMSDAEETPLAALAAQAIDEDPAVGLRAVLELRRLLEELERLHVDHARGQGWSWQTIATALQVSRQTVHEKHAARRKATGLENWT